MILVQCACRGERPWNSIINIGGNFNIGGILILADILRVAVNSCSFRFLHVCFGTSTFD